MTLSLIAYDFFELLPANHSIFISLVSNKGLAISAYSNHLKLKIKFSDNL